jgi:hypothetical protein
VNQTTLSDEQKSRHGTGLAYAAGLSNQCLIDSFQTVLCPKQIVPCSNFSMVSGILYLKYKYIHTCACQVHVELYIYIYYYITYIIYMYISYMIYNIYIHIYIYVFII